MLAKTNNDLAQEYKLQRNRVTLCFQASVDGVYPVLTVEVDKDAVSVTYLVPSFVFNYHCSAFLAMSGLIPGAFRILNTYFIIGEG